MKRITALLPVFVLFALVVVASSAKGDETNPYSDKDGQISKVSADSITVTDKDGNNAKTFAISATTSMTLDGEKCSASDLKKGQSVRIQTSKDDTKTATKVAARKSQ